MVIVRSLISQQLAADRLSKWCNTPRLGRICQVHLYPLTRGQDTLVFLEDVGTPEGQGIMDAAGMANSIVHDDK